MDIRTWLTNLGRVDYRSGERREAVNSFFTRFSVIWEAGLGKRFSCFLFSSLSTVTDCQKSLKGTNPRLVKMKS